MSDPLRADPSTHATPTRGRISQVVRAVSALLTVLLLLGAACGSDRASPDEVPPERGAGERASAPRASPRAGAARATGDDLAPIITVETLPDGVLYGLHRFPVPLASARIDVVDTAFARTLEQVLEAEGASLVINGGFWDPQRQPEGLTIVGGTERVPFAPDLGGGVLVIDEGRGRLLDPEATDFAVPRAASFAQQCKPRLVVGGAVNIRRDDGQRANRTALCLRDGGRTLEVIVAQTDQPHRARGGPSLYALAERLVAIGCEEALNLDGGPSTGVAWRQGGVPRTLPTGTPVRLALVVHLSREGQRGAGP